MSYVAHIAVHCRKEIKYSAFLVSCKSWETSKCGRYINYTVVYCLYVTYLSLPHIWDEFKQ